MHSEAAMLKGCKWMRRPALALLLGASLLVGCSDDDDVQAPVPASTGTVQLNWTIGGRTDPELCARFGVAAFHVVVFNAGWAGDRLEFPCEDFSASLKLFVGDYAVRMTLLDQGHFRLTERSVTTTFILDQDEQEVIDVDFPESSFLNGGSASGNAGAGAGGEASGNAGSPTDTGEGGATGTTTAGASGASG